ncbi:MAG TPA: hypothetical protein VG387_05275 [Rhizomicrobium sp.]|nr:hypothetical protein [Rhizomicrobium sp.]
MAEIVFDLATKVVAKDQVIWAVFPGRGRRMLDVFIASNCIFLEIPGIALAPGVLSDDKLLRQHVAMSDAIYDYRVGSSSASVPSRRASTYAVKRGSSFSAAVGNVRNMYARMKPGDLVVMGGRSLYQPIYIGEVETAFAPGDVIQINQFGTDEVPVRKVRWLDVDAQRRFLSERLSHLLSNRKAIISIPKDEFGDEVYKFAYGDYIFGEDSRYVFAGPRYKNIATTIIPGIDLLSYFIAAYNADELGQMDKFRDLEIEPAIARYFKQETLYSFELDFASPGGYIVHAKKAALALTVAVLVSATDGTMSYTEARAAAVTNSAYSTAQTLAPLPIPEKYRSIMENMGAGRYNELVKKNKEAQAGVGLRVRVKHHRRKA